MRRFAPVSCADYNIFFRLLPTKDICGIAAVAAHAHENRLMQALTGRIAVHTRFKQNR